DSGSHSRQLTKCHYWARARPRVKFYDGRGRSIPAGGHVAPAKARPRRKQSVRDKQRSADPDLTRPREPAEQLRNPARYKDWSDKETQALIEPNRAAATGARAPAASLNSK